MVGGGDSACEEAVYLTKYGSHVHLVVRSDKLRASAAMADRVLANDAITVHWNSEIEDVSGDDWMQSMTLRNRIEGSSSTIAVKGLFYAIGHTPNTDLLQGQIDLNEKGYLTTNRDDRKRPWKASSRPAMWPMPNGDRASPQLAAAARRPWQRSAG